MQTKQPKNAIKLDNESKRRRMKHQRPICTWESKSRDEPDRRTRSSRTKESFLKRKYVEGGTFKAKVGASPCKIYGNRSTETDTEKKKQRQRLSFTFRKSCELTAVNVFALEHWLIWSKKEEEEKVKPSAKVLSLITGIFLINFLSIQEQRQSKTLTNHFRALNCNQRQRFRKG